MLNIEDLKVGDELECIDREGMLCNERLPEAWREYMYKQNKFIVNSIYKNCIVYLDGLKMQITAINGIEKYFKKKEQESSFNDLIDVAVQAYKDNYTSRVVLEERGVSINVNKNGYGFYRDSESVADGIKFIQSLYKESFVIECEEDIKHVKNHAKITLYNGNVIEYSIHKNWGDYIVFEDDYNNRHTYNFMVLKCATVEQPK